ncbi:conserved unknown protein [Ectocarpus siliculosus]|uniref:MARVEL domain-containing protein n=1 Tax=Ectocarpus siliculosus TaxID=2880 RepID=D7FQK9_ECTSI|nr:conserved unknown protein [Ectocarpus siliculosus]|eukprot:CBJ30604.1 conserved unknown protein [Ectocarpus siliculosus]
MLSFSYISCFRSKARYELSKLQELIVCYRCLSGAFILLLFPLFWVAASEARPVITPITSFGNGSSWNYGWGRPVLHFGLVFVGMFVDTHQAARLSCLVGMMQAIVLDTLSSYALGTQIDCVQSGRCAVPEHTTLSGLRLLQSRDLASVALATWALLLAYYLSLVIGMCRTRYNFRQLHAGDHNRVLVMRRELAKRSTRNRDDDNIL